VLKKSVITEKATSQELHNKN